MICSKAFDYELYSKWLIQICQKVCWWYRTKNMLFLVDSSFFQLFSFFLYFLSFFNFFFLLRLPLKISHYRWANTTKCLEIFISVLLISYIVDTHVPTHLALGNMCTVHQFWYPYVILLPVPPPDDEWNSQYDCNTVYFLWNLAGSPPQLQK